MTTASQAVANREGGPVKLMWASITHFEALLPDHIDAKSFLGTAAAALYASEDLMKCATANPGSLMAALYQCAALGHQPGTDEYYLTPRKGGKSGPAVVGIEGYRGIVERMYRSGAVRSVIVREVCAKDHFRFLEGVDEKPLHSVAGPVRGREPTGADFFGKDGHRDRGPMVGVYAYAILDSGAVSRVVLLDRDDVMAARDASDAKDTAFSPWNRLDAGENHPELQGRSMWWKTAARRLEPWVPTSAEYRRAQARAAARTHTPVENTAQVVDNGGDMPVDNQPAGGGRHAPEVKGRQNQGVRHAVRHAVEVKGQQNPQDQTRFPQGLPASRPAGNQPESGVETAPDTPIPASNPRAEPAETGTAITDRTQKQLFALFGEAGWNKPEHRDRRLTVLSVITVPDGWQPIDVHTTSELTETMARRAATYLTQLKQADPGGYPAALERIAETRKRP